MEQILLGVTAGETDAKQINPRQTRMRTWGGEPLFLASHRFKE